MSPDEIRSFRAEHGLTQAVLSARLPVAKRTLEDWERGVARPPEYLTRALRDLERELTGEQDNGNDGNADHRQAAEW